jgi:hypothetical protein
MVMMVTMPSATNEPLKGDNNFIVSCLLISFFTLVYKVKR